MLSIQGKVFPSIYLYYLLAIISLDTADNVIHLGLHEATTGIPKYPFFYTSSIAAMALYANHQCLH